MRALLVTILFLAGFTTVLAQPQFNIRVFGGEDTEPPTTPTLLSAFPISSNQIDLAWSAATDNFIVAGYVIFRDGSPVATTTLTTFSDTGLLASTTYTYGVQAFDIALNYSTTSNLIAATTLTQPSPPDPPVATSSPTRPVTGTARVMLETVVVTPGISTTSFLLRTNRPARFELRWGRTDEYELGYVMSGIFSDRYETILTGLEPGTMYRYQLVGYSVQGVQSILERGSFTTLPTAEATPLNVTRFTGIPDGENVRLAWIIPSTVPISYVRIVRSHLGFPRHPYDGAVVYQGNGEQTIDTGVLSRYSPVYYTAFVVDDAGNVSSGAVIRVFSIQGAGEQPPIIDRPTLPGIEDEAIVTIRKPDVKLPELSDIYIKQQERLFTLFDTTIVLEYRQPFILSIPREALAQNLKSIVVTLTDPTDARREYSFLLRLNKDNTAYEAAIHPVGVIGQSELIIAVYDFEAAIVATYQKTLRFQDLTISTVVFEDSLERLLKNVIPLLLLPFLVILLMWFALGRKRSEDN